MDLQLITQNIEKLDRQVAERTKVKAVIAQLDKICRDHGFADYAGFLTAATALQNLDGEPEQKLPRKVRKPQKRLTEDQISKVSEGYKLGKSASEIAKELGAKYPVVYNRIKKLKEAAESAPKSK
jgi:hypothetical protein